MARQAWPEETEDPVMIKCVECEKGPCRDKMIGVPCNGLVGAPDDDWPDEDWEDEELSIRPIPADPRAVAICQGNPRSVLTDNGAVMVGGKQKQRPAPTGCTGVK